MKFAEAVCLVTGGSSGIGLATARQLAARGAHVWLLARDEARLQAALAQVEAARLASDQRCGYVIADVASAEQASAAVAKVTEQVGLPDLLLNSAGVARPGYFQELDLEVFRWTMGINFFGTVHMAKAVVPGMIARGSGHIVNMSSAAGFLGVFGYTAYGSSKYAIRGFSEVLRTEMKPHGVRVSVVFPTDVDTPQLAYENQFKPPETKAIAGTSKPLTPDQVAAAIIEGVEHNRFAILPGAEAKLTYRLAGIFGGWIHPVLDHMVAGAQTRSAPQAGANQGRQP